MPADDQRIEEALEAAAPVVDTGDVLTRVATKRARRRRTLRFEAGALALVILVAVGLTAAFITRDDGSSPHVAAPPAGLPSAHIVTGDDAAADGQDTTMQAVTLDTDPGVLLGPMYVGSGSLSTASHDRGTDGLPLTHVVRINGTHVIDIVNFKAEIISIAEGEGARWALTRNPRATGSTLPETFLKRIGAIGDPTSVTLPLDSDPVGTIAAVGGAVWVPVRDGVLQFDPSNGNFLRRLDLPAAASRQVAQIGKAAYVTDGGTIRRLDPASGLAESIDFGPGIIGLASSGGDGRILLRNEQDGTDHARVASAISSNPVRVVAILPAGFRPDGLTSSATRTWATGTVDDAPAIVLLANDGIRASVVVDNAREATLAWTGPHTVTVVTGDGLFEIRVP